MNKARIRQCPGCTHWFDSEKRFRTCTLCGGSGVRVDPPRTKGWIYFITEGDGGTKFVKIGMSKFHPERRVKELQIGNPRKLVLLVCREVDGIEEMETSLHNLFADYRAEGEWFKLAEDVQEFISDLQKAEIIGG